MARAAAFERDLARAASPEVAELPLGVGVSAPDTPQAHLATALHVVGVHPGLTPALLAAACDDHHGAYGHRRAVIEDHGLGARLAPGLRAQGWHCAPLVCMVLRRPADRAPLPGLATEADEPRFQRVERTTDAELVPADAHADLTVARARLRAVHAGTRRLVGVDAGTDAAHATLFSDGHVAQVEDVVTLTPHRGRGLGRAIVAAACELACGHELTFLDADAADWPRRLYGQLGFDAVGGSWVMSRTS